MQSEDTGKLNLEKQLNKVIPELAKKDDKHHCARLKAIFLQLRDPEPTFAALLKAISSSDSTEKLGGLVGLEEICKILSQNQEYRFVNKFQGIVFKQFQFAEDAVVQKTGDIFRIILRLGGHRIDNVIQSYLTNALQWLKNPSSKDIKKRAAFLVLQSLLAESPYSTFKKIFQGQSAGRDKGYIWGNLRAKSLGLRRAALSFFQDCIKQICQKDQQFQRKQLSLFFDQLRKQLQSKEDEHLVHGNIQQMRVLLTYANSGVFSPQDVTRAFQYIRSKRHHRSNIVVKAVVKTIPVLARAGETQLLRPHFVQFMETLTAVATKRSDLKAESYQSIAELMLVTGERQRKWVLQQVWKLLELTLQELREQRQRKQTAAVALIVCLHKVFNKFRDALVESDRARDQMQQLVDLVLLGGLNEKVVELLSMVSTLNFVDICQSVHLKLLHLVSIILMNKLYSFGPESEGVLPYLDRFRQKSKSLAQFTPREKAEAIKALMLFKFKNVLHSESLALFVKDYVLNYLEDPSKEVRLAAASAAFMLYVRKGRVGHSQMGQILKKLIDLAMREFGEIGQLVFTQLYENWQNFDSLLNTQDNLQKLFICVCEPNRNIQICVVKILARLALQSPGVILPKLKMTLFHIIERLSSSQLRQENLQPQIQLLRTLIRHSDEVVLPHLSAICEIMLRLLPEVRTLSPALFRTFGAVCEAAPAKALPHIDDVMPHILGAMQDKSDSRRRESALICLISVVKCTGFVVVPYYLYPDLMSIILSMLRVQTHSDIRSLLLQLMGGLGALQKSSLRQQDMRGRTRQQAARASFKRQFSFFTRKDNAIRLEAERNPVKELHNYYQDLVLLDSQTFPGKRFEVMKPQLASEVKVVQRQPGPDPLDSEQPTSRNQVIKRFCINQVLNIIEDESLYQHHSLALQTLTSIVGILRHGIRDNLKMLVPRLLQLLSRQSLQAEVLRLLEKLVRNCQKDFSRAFVYLVVDHLMRQTYRVHTGVCFDILQALTVFCKPSLKHLMESVIRASNIVLESTGDKALVRKIFLIFIQFQSFMNPHLHMVIPFLCSHFLEAKLRTTQFELVRQLSKLITSFAVNCPSTIQYLSLIAKSLFKALEAVGLAQSSIEVAVAKNSLIDCAVALLVIFKENFIVYLPLIHQKAQHEHHNYYKRCVDHLLGFNNLNDIDAAFTQEQLAMIIPTSSGMQVGDFQPLLPQSRLENPDLIVNQFTSNKCLFYQDWAEWLRKTSQELLRQSPNPVLRCCWSLGEEYQQLATNLYNLAFSQVWSFLSDLQKYLVVKELSAIIANNSCQSIHQDILNLAQYMLHQREGLQISFQALGTLAERTQAYAKALFYREREYEKCPQRNEQRLFAILTQMGHNDSVRGLVQQKQGRHPKQNCQEKLMECKIQKAKGEQNSVGSVKFLSNLACWEDVIETTQQLDPASQKEVANLACQAALGLRKWDSLAQYQVKLDSGDRDKRFYEGVVALVSKRYDQARQLIKLCRREMETQVSQLLLQSYGRAFDGLLRLQQLFELQEIIELRSFEQRVNRIKEGRYLQKKDLFGKLLEKKSALKQVWKDRLSGCPKDLEVWQKVLAVRGVLLTKNEDLANWIKLCKLAIKANQLSVAYRIIALIKKEVDKTPPLVLLTELEIAQREGTLEEAVLLERAASLLSQKLDVKLKAKIHYKVGSWLQSRNEGKHSQQILEHFKEAFTLDNSHMKAWHSYAMVNFQALDQKQPVERNRVLALASVRGFIRSIGLGSVSQKLGKFCLQDTLRLLNIVFTFGSFEDIQKQFRDSFKVISTQIWIFVVPQIIARMSATSECLQALLHDLLIHIGTHHPQALIYPLTVACKSRNDVIRKQALLIHHEMINKNAVLVEEAQLIAEALNHAAIKLHELWKDGIEQAIGSFMDDKRFHILYQHLNGLHQQTSQRNNSNSDRSFKQQFGGVLREAKAWLQCCKAKQDDMIVCQTIGLYIAIYKRLQKKLQQMKAVFLENVSPHLLARRNCQISIPGMYKPDRPVVRIAFFHHQLPVLLSKQRPRKLEIMGNDGKQYGFLLKGREDLRQDQRVMQLFSLVNKLLATDPQTERKDLRITRFSVIPLSVNTGLIGWVRDCDTLLKVIKQYRDTHSIAEKVQQEIVSSKCRQYQTLPLLNKLQIFRYVLQYTRGQDIQKMLWIKSPSSEIWLQRRTTYTRSLATMSMVGYILGLGDRHPSNIMLQRHHGNIVHIDFGDCFEVTMTRKRLPQKVPFRLTRMLVKAMDVAALVGSFRITAQAVMSVLRNHRESLMAMLQAFVYDPLINWRLLKGQQGERENNRPAPTPGAGSSLILSHIQNAFRGEQQHQRPITPKRKNTEQRQKPTQTLNIRALQVTDRIKKKLTGKDFGENLILSVKQQVDRLIEEATSHQNICQSYIGWCPFW